MSHRCEGPLVWHDAPGPAAILECQCGYMVISGSLLDKAHTRTPVIRGGLA